MNPLLKLIMLTQAVANLVAYSCAQEVIVERRAANLLLENEILLHLPPTQPAGLLVLLPAGNIHSFDERSGYTPSTLPRLMATNGVVTLITAPSPGRGAGVGLYAADDILQELDGLILDVTQRFKIPLASWPSEGSPLAASVRSVTPSFARKAWES